jgi:hypothetical protein
MPAVKYVNSKGERLQGSTTIISQQLGWNKATLMAWQAREFKAGNDPTDKSRRAMDIGTLCHHYISCYILKQEIDSEFQANYELDALVIADRALEQFKKMVDENGFEMMHSELSLISEQYQYGGTIDIVMKQGDTIILGDIKTSNTSKSCPTGIYPDHLIQLGSYWNLLLENKICEPHSFKFIHISKDIKEEDEEIVKIIPAENEKIKLGWEAFKDLLSLKIKQNGLKI